nr:MAG TPA: hypothetical protein [Caudoviricetes sp.]
MDLQRHGRNIVFISNFLNMIHTLLFFLLFQIMVIQQKVRLMTLKLSQAQQVN